MKPRWLKEEEGPATWASLERAANLLGALCLAISDRLESVMASAAGCSVQALAALQWIERAPGIRPAVLARALGIGTSGVTRLLDHVESDGLILRARDRRDQRQISIRLSELGARRVRLASLARARFLEGLVTQLPFFLRPRLIRIAERLLTLLVDGPRSGLRMCRHCRWPLCRGDPAAPCPVALAQARCTGSTRAAYDPDAPRLYQDRRLIEGAHPPIELWLEPAHVAFRLGLQRRLEVICNAPGPGRLDLERSPEGHIALYAWEHATFSVLEAGREIFVQERPLSLALGTGDSPRKRIESMFGDFARRRSEPPRRWL